MAPYLVQWEAMRYAKKHNKTTYDFLGIGEHLEGVTSFKKKFGGYEVEYVGTFELVTNRLWYIAVRLLKWLRAKKAH